MNNILDSGKGLYGQSIVSNERIYTVLFDLSDEDEPKINGCSYFPSSIGSQLTNFPENNWLNDER